MSKVSFRCKPVDTNRPMPVFHAADLPDLSEYAAINRSQPSMPTGMEKDEEMELHLQRVLSSQQATCSGVQDAEEVVIPTPRVISDVQTYHDVYNNQYRQTDQLIKVEASLSFEPEVPEYDCDSDDEAWLSAQNQQNMPITTLQFETVMDRLETASLRQVVKLSEAKSLLLEMDNDVIQNVYDYWIQKRLKMKQPLVHRVRTDKLLGANDQPQSANPYLAFRRRAEKMQTRKNRKNDEDSYEKILKLSHDLRKAVTLLDMVKHREISKRELIRMDQDVIEARVGMDDFDGRVYNQIVHDTQPSFSFIKSESSHSSGGRQRKRKRTSKHSSLHNNLLGNNNSGNVSDDNDSDVSSSRADGSIQSLRNYLQKAADEFNRPVNFSTSTAATTTTEALATAGSRHRIPPVGELSDRSIEQLLSTDLYDSSAQVDGQYAFKRKRGCQYYAPLSTMRTTTSTQPSTSSAPTSSCYPNWSCPTSSTSRLPQPSSSRHCASFYPTYLRSRASGPGQGRLRSIGLARRRVGRGGRVLFDRLMVPPPSSRLNHELEDEGLDADEGPDHPYDDLSSAGCLSDIRSNAVLWSRTRTTTTSSGSTNNRNTSSFDNNNNDNKWLIDRPSSLLTQTTTTTGLHTSSVVQQQQQQPQSSRPSAVYIEHVNTGGHDIHFGQSIYYRPRHTASSAHQLDHDYASRPGWPKSMLSGTQMEIMDGLRPDSGYSSPVDHRSRSLVNTSRLTRSHQELSTLTKQSSQPNAADLLRPNGYIGSQFAAVETPDGRRLNVPYKIGVSAGLYASHQNLLEQSWRRAQPCASQSSSNCCGVSSSKSDPDATATTVDRYQAVFSAGAFQSRDSVTSLWQTHEASKQSSGQRRGGEPYSNGGGGNNNNNGKLLLNGNVLIDADTDGTRSTGRGRPKYLENGHEQQPKPASEATTTTSVTYALPTPSPSPNSPQSDDSAAHHDDDAFNNNRPPSSNGRTNNTKFKTIGQSRKDGQFLTIAATAIKHHSNSNHRQKLNGRHQFADNISEHDSPAENGASLGETAATTGSTTATAASPNATAVQTRAVR